jgi:hypothetical protein|tara:strand:- start:4 stop:498 length:495 start_codon:yes stop_codon:yes gene_type:complete
MSSMTEDTAPLDLTFLIERHKKELWEYKEKESEWIRTQNQLDGHKKIVDELSVQIKDLRKKADDAILETSLVKAVGMNSPEMKRAKERIEELEEGLANALAVNDSHQKLNGKLQVELTECKKFNIRVRQEVTIKEQEILELHVDNKQLASQVEDQVNRLRKAGM